MKLEPFNQQHLAQLDATLEEALFAPHILVFDQEGTVTARSGSLQGGMPADFLDGLTNIGKAEETFAAKRAPSADEGTLLTLIEGVRNVLSGRLAAYRQECGFPAAAPQRRFIVSVAPTGPDLGATLSVIEVTALRRARATLETEAVRVRTAIEGLEGEWMRLERLVTLDGLTGLKNYRTLHENLHYEWERTQRYRTDLSLLLLDLDHFKAYNDSFGHPAGNLALQHVAEALRTTARETDFLARYGGEEFAVLLPNTDREGALAMARRFQNALLQVSWTERPVTMSVGVASCNPASSEGADSPLRLIEYADEALYTAKNTGRNCVFHFSDLASSDGAVKIDAIDVEGA